VPPSRRHLLPRHRPPPDYVSRLIDDWRKERPDLAVDPVAIVYRIGRLAAHLAAQVDKVFASSGVSSADFAVLANLRRSGSPYQLSQRRLMDALGLTSGTISVRIDRLVQRGIVRRDPDPDDGRGVLVTLTDGGQKLFDALAPDHLANEARLVAALDSEQQAELARLLQILLVEYEPLPGQRPDEQLDMTVAPAHVGYERRVAVGLEPVSGLLVEAIKPGGRAAAAGIQPGDLLVSSATRDLRSLTCLALAVAEGGAPTRRRGLQLRLRRGGQELTAIIETAPPPPAGK
jgi:DNA-binding MarR family transcriptional regulator